MTAVTDLEREYRELKPRLVSDVARKLPWLSRDEVDDLYNPAWAIVWARLRTGRAVDSLPGFLHVTMVNLGKMELRRADARHGSGAEPPEEVESLADLEQEVDDRRTFALFGEAVAQLTRQQQAVVWARLVHEDSSEQAAERLGLTARQVKRAMERATRALGPALSAIAAGRWCDEQSESLARYAAGRLKAGHPAIRHFHACPACAREIRRRRALLAAVPPPIWLLPAASAGGLEQVRTTLAAARHALVNLLTRSYEPASAVDGAAASLAGAGAGAGGAAVLGLKGAAVAASVAVAVGAPTTAVVRAEREDHRADRAERRAEAPRAAAVPRAGTPPAGTVPLQVVSSTATTDATAARARTRARRRAAAARRRARAAQGRTAQAPAEFRPASAQASSEFTPSPTAAPATTAPEARPSAPSTQTESEFGGGSSSSQTASEFGP